MCSAGERAVASKSLFATSGLPAPAPPVPGHHDVWNPVDNPTAFESAPEPTLPGPTPHDTPSLETPLGTTAGSTAPGSTAPRRLHRLRLPAVAAVAALMIGGGVATANAHKNITLDIDGALVEVGTFAGSVAGVLEDHDIRLAERDVVAPGLEATLADGDEIVVRVARPLVVTTAEGETTVWTTERTVADALDVLGARGESVSVVASRSAADGRSGLSLDLDVDGRVNVVADGRTRSVSGAVDVAEALTRADVEPAGHDRVTVAPATDGTITVTVQRVVVTDVSDVTEIPFESVTEKTADLYRGQSKVDQEGVPGALTTVSRLVLVDDVEESRRVLSETVTAEPVTERVLEGTTARPVVAAPAPSSGTVVEGDVWAQLAQCESGGNPTIVSRNGLYHGLYQFSVGTWQGVGGSGLPSEASAEEQTQRAQALQARSGWGQWPACSLKLGLR